MEYYCNGKNCPYEGPRPFVLAVPAEICADEHNCATLFCPHCHNELIKCPTAGEYTPTRRSPKAV